MLRQLRFALSMVALAMLSSCGGGGSNLIGSGGQSRGVGQATINVNWPAPSRTRLIPGASASLVVTFIDKDGKTRSTTVIPKPPSGPSVTKIKNLPVGDLSLVVKAYPEPDGTGTAQAIGRSSVKIEADKDTPVMVSPNSTIVRVVMSLGPGDSLPMKVGGEIGVDASCRDASDAVVLTDSSFEKWESSDSSIATVSFGLVHAVKNGTTTIKYIETESGATGSVVVTVADTHTYTLGGPNGGAFSVDDNLDVYLNGVVVYTTGSGLSGTHPAVTFSAQKGDKVRVVLRDTYGHCYSLSALTLADGNGHSQVVDAGINGGCGFPGGDQGVRLDHTFTIPF